MSIADELCCDVVAALLARQAISPAPPSQPDLTELVLTIHAALRQLSGEERRRRRALILNPPPPASNAATAGG